MSILVLGSSINSITPLIVVATELADVLVSYQ